MTAGTRRLVRIAASRRIPRDVSGAVESVTTEEPEEQTKPAPSGRLLLRMPRTLHAELARSAEREGTSLNQFITGALASAIGWRDENGETPGGVRRAVPPASYRPPRLVVMLLVANAVAIGLAAIAAIAVLLVAWQG